MAFAAVKSLSYTIDRFLRSDDDHHIQIVQNSSPKMIKLLEEEARSLANVLQGLDNNIRRFSSKRLNALDAQITEAIFKLEDVLESHLLHQFVSQSEKIHQHQFLFCVDIEELKQDIDSLIETVNKLKAEYIYELSTNNLPIYEDDEDEDEDDVIVKSEGMAGIGKTTLARKLFEDPLLSRFFESRAFVTVGPEYQLEDVYLDILKQLDPNTIHDDEIIMLLQGDHQQRLGGLERRLNGYLEDRKCLIVLDDVWDYKLPELDIVQYESIVLVTTRLKGVTNFTRHREVPFLDKKESWDLLCANVFGEDSSSCTPQLERAGKRNLPDNLRNHIPPHVVVCKT